jgi:hypothetical protein
MFNSRRQREELAALRAEVTSLQARLGSDISTLDAGDSPLCRQALNDAAERNTAAGSLLATATTPGELQVAKRIVIEGLTSTRVVREKLGLSLGPDLPDSGFASVSGPTTVQHGNEQHVAHPDFHPERPHFFGGGLIGSTQAPAGYYKTPFWQKALAVGGAIAGAEMIGGIAGELFNADGYGDRDGGDWSDS